MHVVTFGFVAFVNASKELVIRFPQFDDVAGRGVFQIKLRCSEKNRHVFDLSELDKVTSLLVGGLDVVATGFGETVAI